MSTLSFLVLSGCSSDIQDLRKDVATINTEVKRTISLYEESLKTAESLNSEIEVAINDYTLLSGSNTHSGGINPHLENLYSFYNEYIAEVESYSFTYDGKALEEKVEETDDTRIEVDALIDYTEIRYYYDDKSNILEQMYITTLPNGSSFIVSLEWYKGELIRHEEMVSY